MRAGTHKYTDTLGACPGWWVCRVNTRVSCQELQKVPSTVYVGMPISEHNGRLLREQGIQRYIHTYIHAEAEILRNAQRTLASSRERRGGGIIN